MTLVINKCVLLVIYEMIQCLFAAYSDTQRSVRESFSSSTAFQGSQCSANRLQAAFSILCKRGAQLAGIRHSTIDCQLSYKCDSGLSVHLHSLLPLRQTDRYPPSHSYLNPQKTLCAQDLFCLSCVSLIPIVTGPWVDVLFSLLLYREKMILHEMQTQTHLDHLHSQSIVCNLVENGQNLQGQCQLPFEHFLFVTLTLQESSQLRLRLKH